MIDYSFSIYELEYYLLIFVRVTCFIFACPFFSMNNTPRRVRITLGVFLSYLLYQAIYPHEIIPYDSILEYTAIVLKEVMTGVLIGLSTSMCNSIVLFAGRLIDMEIGLAMASEYDPTTRENASVTGIFSRDFYTDTYKRGYIFRRQNCFRLSLFYERLYQYRI